MHTGKKAVESVKETAANVAASARSGMEKTKATLQEKGEKMTAHTDVDKHLAEQRKEERMAAAELNKREAQTQNAAQRAATSGAGGVTGHHPYSAKEQGYTAGPNQMSAMTGQPTGGRVVERTIGAHPIGKATGTARRTTGLNSGTTGHGTGGPYTG